MFDEMTDEEFFKMIEEKYGKDWTPEQLDPESEIADEYAKRVSTGL